MIGQRISTKIMPPPPPNYAENLAKGGWRLVERLYGCRTDLHLAWQAKLGVSSPRAKRTAVTRVADGGRANRLETPHAV